MGRTLSFRFPNQAQREIGPKHTEHHVKQSNRNHMSSLSPSNIPNGVWLIGQAVGNFELKNLTTSKGKPMQLVQGKVLAGTEFVTVTQMVEQGKEMPYMYVNGEQVRAQIVPNWKANGVLAVDVILTRPQVVSGLGEKGTK